MPSTLITSTNLIEYQSVLTAYRSEKWSFNLSSISSTGIVDYPFDNAVNGSFNYDRNATIRSGGSIKTVYGIDEEIPDWSQVYIQPVYSFTSHSNAVYWPVGVFIPSTPKTVYGATTKVVEIELYDKLLILNQDSIENTLIACEGTDVLSFIESQIAETGVNAVFTLSEPLSGNRPTIKTAMTWKAGTTRLKIVNDLLDSVNYFSLEADENGNFFSRKYTSPKDRGIAWYFKDDEYSIYLPGMSYNFDTFGVPNKLVAISTSSGDEEAMTAVATDEDANSPFSFASRGRWVTEVVSNIEADSQQTLGEIANRRLEEAQQVGGTFEISHAYIPLKLNSVVSLERKGNIKPTLAVVEKMSFSTDTGDMVKTVLREVRTNNE